jgi:peptide/nickel transport system substrate-binding protein
MHLIEHCRRLGRLLLLVLVVGIVGAGLCPAAGHAGAGLLRWAVESDAASLDPYTRDETAQLSLLGNVYEPLIRRSADLTLEPGLATSWERLTPTCWRFHLRPGVRWQDGTPFTADDVIFSLHRVQSPSSMLRSATGAIANAIEIDPATVMLETAAPDPILPQQLTTWYMMSRAWAIANATTVPALLARGGEDYATRHAMGTGPFRVAERDPDHRTVLERNALWWDRPASLLDQVRIDVVASATTRLAALAAGEIDLATAIPPQDAAFVAGRAGLKLLAMPELRTIFLGMDQSRDQLLKSDVVGRNPFRDARVRLAMALAIDEPAIAARIMRGQARPTWLLWAPGIVGYDAALDHRPPPDPARAKALLAEAGYPDGFGVTLDCPNDRYVRDEAICTAVAGMLARVGIRVDVDAEPKARFFSQIGPPRYETSFYLLGWTPPTYDAQNVLQNLAATRSGARGAVNFGGFSDPAIDALIGRIGTEGDPVARLALIAAAARRLQAQVAYIPLHQQELLWGERAGLSVPQSADGFLRLRLAHFLD